MDANDLGHLLAYLSTLEWLKIASDTFLAYRIEDMGRNKGSRRYMVSYWNDAVECAVAGILEVLGANGISFVPPYRIRGATKKQAERRHERYSEWLSLLIKTARAIAQANHVPRM